MGDCPDHARETSAHRVSPCKSLVFLSLVLHSLLPPAASPVTLRSLTSQLAPLPTHTTAAHSRAPAAHSRAFVRTVSPATRLASTPPDEEEGGLDLDLGEMFEMFDAADKEEDFEKAAERIKGDKEGK